MKTKKFPHNLVLLVIITVICISLFYRGQGRALSSEAYATGLADGDTIFVVLNNHKDRVRLLGIDCPESSQLYGNAATALTEKLLGLEGKRKVKIRLEFDIEKRDKYGRLLAYVYTRDNTMINSELIKQGLAVKLNISPNNRYRQLFADLEKKARHRGLNIWNPDKPLPMKPSQYRKVNR